jgi:membrane-associated phospholipid phosphatase
LAAVNGHIEPVPRIIAGMWDAVGIAPAKALFENRGEFYNQEAAVPSLHAAYTMLVLLFFWGAGRWARVALVAYVLYMAFILVYSGEHYVSDILLGWLYSAGVVAGVGWVRGRRARRTSSPPSAREEPDRAVEEPASS